MSKYVKKPLTKIIGFDTINLDMQKVEAIAARVFHREIAGSPVSPEATRSSQIWEVASLTHEMWKGEWRAREQWRAQNTPNYTPATQRLVSFNMAEASDRAVVDFLQHTQNPQWRAALVAPAEQGGTYQVNMLDVPLAYTPQVQRENNRNTAEQILTAAQQRQQQGRPFDRAWKEQVGFEVGFANWMRMEAQRKGEIVPSDDDLRSQYGSKDPHTRQMDVIFVDAAEIVLKNPVGRVLASRRGR